MSAKSNSKTIIQIIGIVLFSIAMAVFIAILGMSKFELDQTALLNNFDAYHQPFIEAHLDKMGSSPSNSSFAFSRKYYAMMQAAQADILNDVETNLGLTTSDGEYWSKILKDDKIKSALFPVAKASSSGYILDNWGLLFGLSILLGIFGALLYILPKNRLIPGIKNNHIYHSTMHNKGWLGIATGVYLIGFYIVLYFYPEHLVNWVILVDPISEVLSGGPASQWFLYGFLYTIAILVMGIRMLIKYRHNRYQIFRTASVMFFQTAFAFLIPQILVLLNKPSIDFKNIWPLDYSFFFEYRLSYLIESGGLGVFMLVWGIALIVIGVPLFTFFYGKRWYCSWVCGCGGLAETLGDPYRQLSDKSLNAWKIERWVIHSVLVFAVIMTGAVLYTYYTGSSKVLFLDSYKVRGWYGFAIGSIFAGVVGTGFYPLMGNRVWCRFGCPLAAYLGLVQKLRSRFRITTNGSQCISCGNCSTYCEMGIDVRWYAQRGQDIVRSSCVGCGICSAVCPRGVLRLENGPDISNRTTDLRTIHITEDQITLIQ